MARLILPLRVACAGAVFLSGAIWISVDRVEAQGGNPAPPLVQPGNQRVLPPPGPPGVRVAGAAAHCAENPALRERLHGNG